MKKVIVGAALGAVAAGVIYALKKNGKLDHMCDGANIYAKKAKRDLKNVVAASKNQAEYLKDRVAYEINKAKS